mmetsp:Transcript_10026/g.18361  ORF Transcript_10026/g.18361 Transcript_10026/m.18361 type:complete len:163 (+) Transcript_10026:116-604(+)
MVYPKHQALPSSSHKKIKSSAVGSDFETPATTTTTYAASDVSYRGGKFTVICDMLGNYNTMIAKGMSTIKKMEETTAKSNALMNEKFDDILQRIQSLDQRLGDIEFQTKTNAEDSVRSSRAIDDVFDTVRVLESRMGSIERRVSGIERLILRSRKRRRTRVD